MAAINVPTCEASDKPTPDIVSLAPTLQSVRSLAIGKGERESCCSCAKVRTVAAVIATTLDPLTLLSTTQNTLEEGLWNYCGVSTDYC